MARSDYNSPYKRFAGDWDRYKLHLDRIEEFLKTVKYDGFKSDSRVVFDATTIQRFQSEGEEYPRLHNVFLLPAKHVPIDLTELLLPENYPEFPLLPNNPIIKLEDSEYPDGFWKKDIESDIEKRKLQIERANRIAVQLSEKKSEFELIQNELRKKASVIEEGLKKGESWATELAVQTAHRKYTLPDFCLRKFEVTADRDLNVVLVEFDFPDYATENIIIGNRKSGHDFFFPKYAKDLAKRKIIKNCLYSLTIRAAYLAAIYSFNSNFKTVVVNVSQDWFDPATGQPKRGVIASLQAPLEILKTLDLSKLDAEVCFKSLKGISTPSFQVLSPIRPIMVLNKSDNRLIVGRDVDSELAQETNLAAMDWEDFEHLVAQLFEWEFAKQGIEVRVTRASRDRGVDAILFDPDPLRGGKYVLQAKRYTRTVDVSAVRDLYGTVMNEGANRGILITTASFGPDSYEFVKDKNISLVDGANLLVMLQRHGKKYRIDLDEAKAMKADDN